MEKTLVSPLARELAKNRGVDLTQLKGSGPLGRIILKDVENFQVLQPKTQPQIQTQKQSVEQPLVVGNPQPKVVSHQQTNAITISPIRNAIAKALKNSQQQVAYVSLLFEANATRLWNFRKEILPTFLEKTSQKVTFLPFIIKSFALALQEFRVFGAKLSADQKSLLLPEAINIGIAVDTPFGLMVPVIREADKKSIAQIQQEVVELATKCRNKTIRGQEMSGGVFTITNYGSVGAVTGTPIINYPEIAIGGVGVIKDQVLVKKDGSFEAAKILPITVAADHRWVDGADIGRFAKRVLELLESPDSNDIY